MWTYAFLLISIFSILLFINVVTVDKRSTKNSYFNYRKKTLENADVQLYPRPNGSNVNKRYYTTIQKNTHDYKRLINQPDLCSKHERVFLLIAIRTIYSHFGRREILREQYSHALYINYREDMIVKFIFLFAKTNDSTTEKLIREESRKYNDIIQEDFVESYVNVSLKAIMAWKWALEFCPNTNYVMVENDEAYVDLDKLVVFLLRDLSMGRTDDHFAVCFALGNRGNGVNLRKFAFLRKHEVYQGHLTPLHCHGVVYAAHIDVINKLYKASLTSTPFMPTDIWIGVLSEKLRLTIPKLNYLYIFPHSRQIFDKPDYQNNKAMLLITDWSNNKGKELSLMRKIHSKIKKYWIRNERKRNNVMYLTRCVYMYIFNNTYIVIFLIGTLIILFVSRIFKVLYSLLILSG